MNRLAAFAAAVPSGTSAADAPAREECPRTFIEYEAAMVEIQRLEDPK